jgi:hypothetical protein
MTFPEMKSLFAGLFFEANFGNPKNKSGAAHMKDFFEKIQ